MLKGGVKVGPGIGESRTALATGVSSSSEEEELSRDQVIFPGTKTCLHIQQIELILTVGFEVELSVKEGKQQEEEEVGWGGKGCGGSGGGKRNHQRPLGSQPH